MDVSVHKTSEAEKQTFEGIFAGWLSREEGEISAEIYAVPKKGLFLGWISENSISPLPQNRLP